MKYFLFFLLSSSLFSQRNAFNPEQLFDPEPKWPEILNPLDDNDPKLNIDRLL